jgi:hypothetical protein
LVHKGQEIDEETGEVIGDMPKTRTLGFRWGAIDNPFQSAGRAGAEEWLAKRAKDKENAEREICQFTNAIPYKSPTVTIADLTPDQVGSRSTAYERGIIPPNCIGIAIAIDTHKRKLYWEGKAVLRWPDDGRFSLHVFDHQILRIDANKLLREAVIGGLTVLKKRFDRGWQEYNSDRRWHVSQVWVDSSWAGHQKPVYMFCAAANKGLRASELIWRPLKGHGEGQRRGITPYRAPEAVPGVQSRSSSNRTLYVGNEYHINRVHQGKTDWMGVQLVHCNSDVWKFTAVEGFKIDEKQSGAITLFDCDSDDRDTYEAQMCAEIQTEKPGRNRRVVATWEQISSENHYFDTCYMSAAAADFVLHHHRQLQGASMPRPDAKQAGTGRPTAAQLAQQYAARGR